MSTISINQSGYIERMLIRLNSRPAKTPLDPSLPLLKATSNDKRADATEYQEISGSLNHLAVFSRPDIAFAVGKLCSFNSDPTVTHMKAARHVLRYLLHTKHFTITYGGAPNLTPLVYVDADWVSDPNDHKSTTGYLVLINGGAVAWISHKQQSVAISTMESEYMALSDASREAIARSQFFDDLNILIGTPLLFCDNQAALTLAQRPIRYHRSKHINIRYHFIRDCLENDQIVINYIPMENQLADVLTKALPPLRHQRCITE
jgi:hypothetical protein